MCLLLWCVHSFSHEIVKWILLNFCNQFWISFSRTIWNSSIMANIVQFRVVSLILRLESFLLKSINSKLNQISWISPDKKSLHNYIISVNYRTRYLLFSNHRPNISRPVGKSTRKTETPHSKWFVQLIRCSVDNVHIQTTRTLTNSVRDYLKMGNLVYHFIAFPQEMTHYPLWV